MDRQSGVALALAVGVSAVLVFTFYGFLAARLLRGYRWPRVVLSAFVAWSIISVAASDRSIRADDPVRAVFDALLLLMSVASVALVWLPASNRYVRQATAERQRVKASLLHVR